MLSLIRLIWWMHFWDWRILISVALLIYTLLLNSLFQDLDCDFLVTHWTTLLLHLIGSWKPLHYALAMENVPATWDFAYLSPIFKFFHAYDTFGSSKFINVFILLILQNRDKFFVFIYQRLVDLFAHFFSIMSIHSSLIILLLSSLGSWLSLGLSIHQLKIVSSYLIFPIEFSIR